MTLSDIANTPDEETITYEGDRLAELLVQLAHVKFAGSTDAATALRAEGVTRVTISPVKGLARRAYEAFHEKPTDAPCGYAFGREWFYQNAAGNAPSLVIK